MTLASFIDVPRGESGGKKRLRSVFYRTKERVSNRVAGGDGRVPLRDLPGTRVPRRALHDQHKTQWVGEVEWWIILISLLVRFYLEGEESLRRGSLTFLFVETHETTTTRSIKLEKYDVSWVVPGSTSVQNCSFRHYLHYMGRPVPSSGTTRHPTQPPFLPRPHSVHSLPSYVVTNLHPRSRNFLQSGSEGRHIECRTGNVESTYNLHWECKCYEGTIKSDIWICW